MWSMIGWLLAAWKNKSNVKVLKDKQKLKSTYEGSIKVNQGSIKVNQG